MRSIVFAALTVASGAVWSKDIAQCSNPSGKGYYPNIGLVSKGQSGWEDEKITNGLVSLVKNDTNEYDILFVDATKRIVSSRNDGGEVIMLSRGAKSVSFLVVYLGQTAEVYTFLIDNSGKPEYIHVTSRAGDAVMITKASVMRGDCAFVNLDSLN